VTGGALPEKGEGTILRRRGVNGEVQEGAEKAGSEGRLVITFKKERRGTQDGSATKFADWNRGRMRVGEGSQARVRRKNVSVSNLETAPIGRHSTDT